MSTSMYWNPKPVEPKRRNIGSLKWILAKKLFDQDGSMSAGPITVDETLIPFLEGLIAGADNGDISKDASILIDAINKYGAVEIIINS